jgi:hypothetical protein
MKKITKEDIKEVLKLFKELMKRDVKVIDRSEGISFKLSEAMFCLNCEVVTPLKECPRCLGLTFPISRWINRKPEKRT